MFVLVCSVLFCFRTEEERREAARRLEEWKEEKRRVEEHEEERRLAEEIQKRRQAKVLMCMYAWKVILLLWLFIIRDGASVLVCTVSVFRSVV